MWQTVYIAFLLLEYYNLTFNVELWVHSNTQEQLFLPFCDTKGVNFSLCIHKLLSSQAKREKAK